MPGNAHVTVIGHLGADAELEYTPGGVPRLRFRVAVDDGTDKAPHTTWYAATMLGARAESWAEWGLVKGALVVVIGRLSVREWVTRQQERRTSCEVLVDQVVRLERPAAAAVGAAVGAGARPPF